MYGATFRYFGSHAGPQAHGYGIPIFVPLGSVGSNGVKPADNVAITITQPNTNIKIRLFIVALSVLPLAAGTLNGAKV